MVKPQNLYGLKLNKSRCILCPGASKKILEEEDLELKENIESISNLSIFTAYVAYQNKLIDMKDKGYKYKVLNKIYCEVFEESCEKLGLIDKKIDEMKEILFLENKLNEKKGYLKVLWSPCVFIMLN